jgi:hypothetical protein
MFHALTPVSETGSAAFISSNSTFDGRGTIVAILDTGVDPGAAGLQVTTDGKPKVIDVVDATGSGDVNTSTVVKASSGHTIRGKSGKTLQLNPGWKNPSGEWHVGMKAAYELYPGPLKSRISASRKEKMAKALAVQLSEAQRAAAAAAGKGASAPAPGSKEADELNELKKRVSMLKELQGEDLGPLYDVVCWHDGSVWRAAVDAQGDGDLRSAVGLTNYRTERQFAVFDDETLLAYAVNIYDDGNVVSIVTDAGSHGTHVASITGAYHPNLPNSDLNGVAPGCQIVSVRIGDMRIGSMETGTGLIRALQAVVENGCHLINMSYGEPSARPMYGRFMELAKHTVLEKNVIFVSSAGNAGPALTTVGAPGGISSHLIGVGAAVTSRMMDDLYALRSKYSALGHATTVTGAGQDAAATMQLGSPSASARRDLAVVPPSTPGASTPAPAFSLDRALDTNFTWSSRGPTSDGALGVSICAPGAAITSVPSWTLSIASLMNGTSMSSPNACGCIALLLSGLQQRGIPFTPYTVKRAIENTASPIVGSTDVFTAGHGMINVPAAFEHLCLADVIAVAKEVAHSTGSLSRYPFAPSTSIDASAPASAVSSEGTSASVPARTMHPCLEITVANQGSGAGESTDRGVYLRELGQTEVASDVAVTIMPVWKQATTSAEKVSYQLRLALETTAPGWISVPSHIVLTHGGRGFSAHVDPRALPVGRVHFAEIVGYEILPTDIETAVGGQHALDTAESNGSVGAVSRKLGPLIRVPVTVIRPETVPSSSAGTQFVFTQRNEEDAQMHTPKGAASAAMSKVTARASPQTPVSSAVLTLRPGLIHRRFLAVPQGASWCEIRVRRVDRGSPVDNAALARAGAVTGPVISGHVSHLSMRSNPEAAVLSAGSSEPLVDAELSTTLLANTQIDTAVHAAPQSAGSASDRLTLDSAPRMVVVHAMQVVRNKSPKFTTADEYLSLRPGMQDGVSFALQSNTTLEVVIAQFWSSLGDTQVIATVNFYGAQLDCSEIDLATSIGWRAVQVTPAVHDVLLKPIAKLTHWTTTIEPQQAANGALPAVAALTARDTLVNGKQAFALTLTYKLSLAEAVSNGALTTGRVHGVLYEASYDSQIMCITNSYGRLVATSDAFPEKLSLPKGEYTVTLQVRHEDAAPLEALRTAALPLEFKRPLGKDKEIALPVADSRAAALAGQSMGRRHLRQHVPMTLFVGCPASSAPYPKAAKAGDVLSGWICVEDYAPHGLVHGKNDAPGLGRHPNGLPVRVYVTSAVAAEAKKPAAASAAKEETTPISRVANAIRDALVAQIKPLSASSAASTAAADSDAPAVDLPFGGSLAPASFGTNAAAMSAVVDALLAAYPKDTAIRVAVLAAKEAAAASAWDFGASASAAAAYDYESVVAAADAALATIDAGALAGYFGLRRDEATMDAAGKAAHKTNTAAKTTLIDLLARKAKALCLKTLSTARAAQTTGASLSASGFTSVTAEPAPTAAAVSDPSSLAPAVDATEATFAVDETATAFASAVAALGEWANPDDYPLLVLEKHLRAGRNATALEVVSKAVSGGAAEADKLAPLNHKHCVALRLHLVHQLGWPMPLLRSLAAHAVLAFAPGPLMI